MGSVNAIFFGRFRARKLRSRKCDRVESPEWVRVRMMIKPISYL